MDIAEKQYPNFSLGALSHVPIHITKTLELRLRELPEKARKAFRCKDVPHNLVAVATLVDAGCSVHTYNWGFEVNITKRRFTKGGEKAKSIYSR